MITHNVKKNIVSRDEKRLKHGFIVVQEKPRSADLCIGNAAHRPHPGAGKLLVLKRKGSLAK